MYRHKWINSLVKQLNLNKYFSNAVLRQSRYIVYKLARLFVNVTHDYSVMQFAL